MRWCSPSAHRSSLKVEEHLDLCQDIGITACLVLDLPHRRWTHQGLAGVDGVGIVSLDPIRRPPWALAVKRTMDVAGALVSLAVFLVAYVRYAHLIRRDSPGPALFSQVRVGRNRRLSVVDRPRSADNPSV
jgi:lipopolysaccharide/colanic/teichoic acid biosynthesis glycosyltransferase